jgi:phosphonate transport system substrate-binding protein
MSLRSVLGVGLAALMIAPQVLAQDGCSNRGQLDTLYCDANNDLVADPPTDPAKWKDPSTLVFAYSPVESPAVYASIFQPFLDHLTQCTGKRVIFYPVQSNSAEIEAMRAGRLHIAGYATGAVGFAVNMAGAIPIAAIGSERGIAGYKVAAIVRADSPYKTLADLKGKKVAHTSPASNSGNLAPRAFFPEGGLTPETDYKPLMSGGHDKSALGVMRGDYDMAPVASDVLDRMMARGDVKKDEVRVIWESKIFPTSSFSITHDMKPELAAKLTACFMSFRFPEIMKNEYKGEDRFLPMTYKDTWAPVREVADKTGTPYNRVAYEAEQKREAEAAARKAATKP